MGPLLMTGLACFGAAVGIGLLASAAVLPAGPPAAVASYRLASRSLVIVLAAFAEGVAVLGIVVGLLAVESGLVTDPADGIFAAGPALLGALIGLGLILVHSSTLDARTAAFCAMFTIGIGLLGVVVAALAWFIAVPGAETGGGLAFTVLGLVSGTAAVGLGVVGTGGIRTIPDGDADALKAYQSRVIYRSTPFQVAGIAASAVAIALVYLA